MEILREFWINVENNLHQVIIWIFNLIHTTIDCLDAIIGQWAIVNKEDYEQENNNRKIGFK